MSRRPGRWAVGGLGLLCALGCGPEPTGGPTTVTVSGSVLGAEGQILRRQLERFDREHPEIRVEMRPDSRRRRPAPPALRPVAQRPGQRSRHPPARRDLDAGVRRRRLDPPARPLRLRHRRRSSPRPSPPTGGRAGSTPCPGSSTWGCSTGEPISSARRPGPWTQLDRGGARARLPTERPLRAGVAGRPLRGAGDGVPRVPRRLRRPDPRRRPGHRGASAGRAGAHHHARPDPPRSASCRRSVLTWHEEEPRFAFQNGEAAFMRNWPYAYALMQDSAESKVAGRFAVAPMPAATGRAPDRGASAAPSSRSTPSAEQPEAAWLVIEYLTRPEQMLERAQVVGQFPTRTALLRRSGAGRRARDSAGAGAGDHRGRGAAAGHPGLHPALGDSPDPAAPGADPPAEPRAALARAAAEMQALLDRVGLGQEATLPPR